MYYEQWSGNSQSSQLTQKTSRGHHSEIAAKVNFCNGDLRFNILKKELDTDRMFFVFRQLKLVNVPSVPGFREGRESSATVGQANEICLFSNVSMRRTDHSANHWYGTFERHSVPFL
jgi:hypothetical protein